jgi:formamidopyrimidine-DNA glycosylase
LAPLLKNKTVRAVTVRRAKILRPTGPRSFALALTGARFLSVQRRGKYLVFRLRPAGEGTSFSVLGHLGMTGRMYLLAEDHPEPKHTAVILSLGELKFVFEDTRYFGRLTLDPGPLERLGPEPLGPAFTVDGFAQALRRSSQAIKIKLLDQRLVAGIGNIYASEALFRARISPRLAARRLSRVQVGRLWRAIRVVLQQAIDWGSTVPLNWAGTGAVNRVFYFGRAAGARNYYEEGLRVYDREGQPCARCKAPIRRLVQAARSTYYCPTCQGRARD